MLNATEQAAADRHIMFDQPGLIAPDQPCEGEKSVVIQYVDLEYSCTSNVPTGHFPELINPIEKLKAPYICLDKAMPQAGLFDTANQGLWFWLRPMRLRSPGALEVSSCF